MRFCGYRDSYASFIRVYAPSSIFFNYRDILESDRFLRNMANNWDEENRNLKHDPPKFVHLKSKQTKVKMTRRSVTSGYLRSSTGAKRSGFTRVEESQSYGDFRSTLIELGAKLVTLESLERGVFELPSELLFEYIEAISGERELGTNSYAISGLLQDGELALEALGSMVKLVLELPDEVESLEDFLESLPKLVSAGTSTQAKSLAYRSTSAGIDFGFNDWVGSGKLVPSSNLKELVGDSERRVRDKFEDDAVLLIKPIALTDESKVIKALTLTATVWIKGDSPDFVVHTQGIDE
jgi:hypothetical protein